MKKEASALKLPFEPGEFLCTWSVPGLNRESVTLSGLLKLEVGKYPFSTLHGDLPIKWIDGGAGFPQRHKFKHLVGSLSSGGSVALMNGELNYWFENQGHASATYAVLSRKEFSDEKPRKYHAIELQFDGIDAIMGKAPISKVKIPNTKDQRTWSATLNNEAHSDWKSKGIDMSIWYNASIRAFNFYEFGMVFGPVLKITSDKALTIEEWWPKWVYPLGQLISLITRKPRSLNSFLAIEDPSSPHAPRDQVFGWDITQSTQNSDRDHIEATPSLVNLELDKANLLALLKKWQLLSDSHHPLIETYGSMTTIEHQHPRSRVLLLLQALEGLHGFETTDKREKKAETFSKEREQVIQRVLDSTLGEADIRFLKKNLMKKPASGLLDALIFIFKSIPADITPDLEGTSLFAELRSSHLELTGERPEKILVKIRNDLSHGNTTYEPWKLSEVADILERVTRSETLRVIGAPLPSRERALKKTDR